MGIFPYTCKACGGAYERCALTNDEDHSDCNGGQFCYSEEVVIFVNGERFEGIYDGYGQVETEDGTIYIPSEFNEYIDGWGTNNLTYDPEDTNIIIYCKSCIE